MPTITADQIEEYLGKPIGTSKWFEISQERINRFADLTEDHQFIHVDEEAACPDAPWRNDRARFPDPIAAVDHGCRRNVDSRGYEYGLELRLR